MGLSIGDPSRSSTAGEINGLQRQTTLKAVVDAKGISPALANALEAQALGAAGQSLYDLINGSSDTHHLDAAARLLWRGYGEGAVSDAEATYLSACIDRRRPLGRRMAPGHASTLGLNGRILGRFISRQRQRSPDRKASRDRRRMLGGSSALPDTMRHHYTEGQRAVLCIVAGEIKHHGVCDLPIDKIAALAGVCRTTVQTALHEARLLGHVTRATSARPEKPAQHCADQLARMAGLDQARSISSARDRVQTHDFGEHHEEHK